MESRPISIPDHRSVVGFSRPPVEGHPQGWDRYLTLDGKQAYLIGGSCETCGFLFERLSGANRTVSPAAISDRLRHGLQAIDAVVVEAVSGLLPGGSYVALLQSVQPSLVSPLGEGDYFAHEQIEVWGPDWFWGLPHDCRVPYYRTRSGEEIESRAEFFEFVVPMVPPTWLDEDTARAYAERLKQSERPTALAVSTLEVREPAELSVHQETDPSSTIAHWCLTHFLLDGHHKVWAASQVRRPLPLLSFLAAEQGIAAPKAVERCLAYLAATASPDR